MLNSQLFYYFFKSYLQLTQNLMFHLQTHIKEIYSLYFLITKISCDKYKKNQCKKHIHHKSLDQTNEPNIP